MFAGGIIPDEDRPALRGAGVAAVFTPGAPLGDIVDWLETTLDRRDTRSSNARRSSSLDLFEYQGKQLFARYGIPVSAGDVAETVDEAVRAADARRLSGRGQGAGAGRRPRQGGRHQARRRTPTRCARTPGNILGMDIKGHVVQRVWVEHASDIAEEYYASFTLDRGAKKYLGMLSAQGGVEIETVADENPDAIARLTIDPVDGLSEAACRAWVDAGEARTRPRPTARSTS